MDSPSTTRSPLQPKPSPNIHFKGPTQHSMSSPIKAGNESMIRPPTMLPISRLPRLNGTPVKTAASGLPVRHEDPAHDDANGESDGGIIAGRKRKGPEDEQDTEESEQQQRSNGLTQGVKRVANGTSRMGTTRTVSGGTSGTAPFVPQPRPPSTIRKPINAIGSTTVRSTISNNAPGSRPGSSMSMASTTGPAGRRPVAGTSSTAGTRPGMSRVTSSTTSVPGLRASRTASNSNLRGLATSQAGVPSTSRLNRSVIAGPSNGVGAKRVSPGSRSVLGRSVGPGSRARSVMMDFEVRNAANMQYVVIDIAFLTMRRRKIRWRREWPSWRR